MLGVTLQSDESNLYLDLVISPQLVQKQLDAKAIQELIKKSAFQHFL